MIKDIKPKTTKYPITDKNTKTKKYPTESSETSTPILYMNPHLDENGTNKN